MGRLTGVPYFSSEDAYSNQLSIAAELRRRRQEKPTNSEVSDDECPIRLKQIEVSQFMQGLFEGRIIRRTAESLGPDKKPLIKLPPMTIVYGILNLTPREYEIIDQITELNISE